MTSLGKNPHYFIQVVLHVYYTESWSKKKGIHPMPIHNTALLYALQAGTYSRPPCMMNDTYFALHFQRAPICLFMEPQCTDGNPPLPVSPWDKAHCGHQACNGQFGGGAVRPETRLLASPPCKGTPGLLGPELLHFPLTLFPTAGSFSTTFKAFSPAPCLRAEHQAGRRATDAHPHPSHSRDAVPGRCEWDVSCCI